MTHPPGLSRTPLILVVDSQEWTARSIESILGSSGCAVLKAYTGRQALELARKVRPDGVIIEMHLPDMTGPDVCRAMRETPSVGKGTPLLVITTAPLGRPERMAAVEAGAWDILRPPLDPEELLVKIGTFVSAKLEADQAREESLCDPATGLYNVRGVLRRVEEIAADAVRSHRPLSCVVVGLEGSSEEAPDGDPSGTRDQLARAIAGVLTRTTRLSDTLGRLGFSDFAVVSVGTDASGARRLSERLTEALRSGEEGLRELPFRVGVHAVADPGAQPLMAVDLLTRATMALRRAPAPVSHSMAESSRAN